MEAKPEKVEHKELFVNQVANYVCEVNENGITKTPNEMHMVEIGALNEANALIDELARVVAWYGENAASINQSVFDPLDCGKRAGVVIKKVRDYKGI